MGNFALNQVTSAESTFTELLSVAVESGCSGIELRNDLASPLFGGFTPDAAAEMVRERKLRIHAIAEVKSFNHLTPQTIRDTEELAEIAQACGAEAIALIPCNAATGNAVTGKDEVTRKRNLRHALVELLPILDNFGLQGFVEPLGFASASLRSKREVVEVIEDIGAQEHIKLVHDTFHHFLAGEPEFFPQHTGMVHISGVVEPSLSVNQFQDEHRVLVTRDDRLHNREQLSALADGGYTGPVSMEVFSSEVHKLPNLAESLRDSFQFISSGHVANVA